MFRLLWSTLGLGARFSPVVRGLNVVLLILACGVGTVAVYSVRYTARWVGPREYDYAIHGGWFEVGQSYQRSSDDYQRWRHQSDKFDVSDAICGAVSHIRNVEVEPWNYGWWVHRRPTEVFYPVPISRWSYVLWSVHHKYSLQWLSLIFATMPLATVCLNAGRRCARRLKSVRPIAAQG